MKKSLVNVSIGLIIGPTIVFRKIISFSACVRSVGGILCWQMSTTNPVDDFLEGFKEQSAPVRVAESPNCLSEGQAVAGDRTGSAPLPTGATKVSSNAADK